MTRFRLAVIAIGVLLLASLSGLLSTRPALAAGEWMYGYPEALKQSFTDDTIAGESNIGATNNSQIAHWTFLIAGAVPGVTIPIADYYNNPELVARYNQG